MILRQYQLDVVAKILACVARLILLVAPTGSGKTVIAAEIIRAYQAQGKRVVFVAHRREIVHQTRDHLAEFGIDAGIILADHPTDPDALVQVCSIQTLHARCIRGRQEIPAADLLIIDEAHHARAGTYRLLIEKYPNAKIIGLTATPCRGDGRGLGNVFEVMLECPQVQDLIDQGHLVATKVFAPSTPDLTGVKTRMGDYVESQLAERVNTAELVGDIVSEWHRLAERRKTVIFASGVAHSRHLEDEFRKSGVRVTHLDGTTDKRERDEILRRLDRGEIEVVCNAMVLVEGWDMPCVSCCVLARPTKSLGLFRQMVGRVLRPAPGKADALVLDHSGATIRHGFVEHPVVWPLHEDQRAEVPVHAARQSGPPASRLVTCTECSAVRIAGKPCPVCGHMPRRPGHDVDVRDGNLAHLDRHGHLLPKHYSPEQKHEYHRMLVGYAVERNYKLGWAAHKFKERFGSWPEHRFVAPLEPSAEVRAWARSRQIAFAKAMQKAQADG